MARTPLTKKEMLMELNAAYTVDGIKHMEGFSAADTILRSLTLLFEFYDSEAIAMAILHAETAQKELEMCPERDSGQKPIIDAIVKTLGEHLEKLEREAH